MNAKLLITLSIIVICLGGCGVLVRGCANYEYSEGERSGVITKFSQKGLIWKSWEGQMVLGGLRQTADGAVANVWLFSLDRQRKRGEKHEPVIRALKEARDQGARVTVNYKQEFIMKPWRGSTRYYVQGIKSKESAPAATERGISP